MANPHGSFIWYELLTPDPDAAKAFYDAVVGWDIEPQPAGQLDYRMIRRGDGGNAGGVMRLSEDMARNGGQPVWLGYVSCHDVDTTVAAITSEGGQVHMPATDMPGVGRIAMITDPPVRPSTSCVRPRRKCSPMRSATSSRSTSRSTFAGTSSPPPIRRVRPTFNAGISGGSRKARCRWASLATMPSSMMAISASVRSWG